jgi:hypothetical protein
MSDLEHRLEQDARVKTEAWTPMNETLTPDDIIACRQMLHSYMKQHDISNAAVAKAIGKSPATVSQFVNGKYEGDVPKLARELRAWMDQDLKRRRAPSYEGFVLTSVAKRIISALQFAAKTSGIAIIYGPAGIGKTMTITAYQATQPGSICLRVKVGASSARGFLSMLCDELRVGRTQWIRPMIDRASEKLKDSGRMIMIDEAHRLGYDALEAVRDIHDITGCPIALLGTARIVKQIDEGMQESKQWITDQFGSRIAIRQDLTAVMRQKGRGGKLLFSHQEIRDIFASQGLRLQPDATHFLACIASTPRLGGLRTVKRVLAMCEVAFGDRAIDLAIVKAAYAKISADAEPPITVETENEQREAAAG